MISRSPDDETKLTPTPDGETQLGGTPVPPPRLMVTGDHPARIGPYRILQPLGEGGMGTVYLAEQERPLKRQVAIKVIKLGMDTREVVARFEAERQALARMDHPNIASVYDAGATEDGRPFFVMERVRGVPITEFCDAERLSTRARLEIFIDVCAAIQHAHQKAILHRDIKPSNVLVSVHDGKPVPKVIDFGIAKATDQRDHQRTAFGSFIGTPDYMSPEQAGITAEDVDSRTDIYSLGVLLYEMLVGSVPFDSSRLRDTNDSDIRRTIREEEPVRPSRRLTTIGALAMEVASRRGTSPTSLERQLRGDLDWIALKALQKDRARRYQSASEFAADIARHLRHEPVVARPPSVAYRAHKFVARNRIGVAAAAVVAVAVVAGLIASTTMYLRAERERVRADDQRDTAERQRAIADAERTAAEAQRSRADLARADADVQREAAERSAAAATTASTQADEQRAIAVQRACAANLLAADISLKSDNREEARRRLDACAPAVRGWEWAYLDRMLDSSWLSLRGTAPGSRWLQLNVSGDGRRATGVVMEGTGFASRSWLVNGSLESDEGSRAVTKSSPGGEIAVSPDGRLAIVSTWTAGGVARDGDLFFATDGRAPGGRPPADLVRLRDVGTGRDLATLDIRAPGQTTAPRDVQFRAPITAGYYALPVRPTTALPTSPVIEAMSARDPRLFGQSAPRPLATAAGAFPYVVDAAFSPDGSRVAVWSWSTEVHVWETRPARLIATLAGHTDGIASAVFTQDNAQLVTASYDRSVRIWDLAQGKPAAVLPVTGSVLAAAVSPDGGRIAAGVADGSVRVWDARSGRQLWSRTDVGVTRTVAFSPDGQWLASAGDDRTVRLWNAAGGVGIAQLHGHVGPINVVAFSADGRILASGSDRGDSTLRLWRVGESAIEVLRHGGTAPSPVAWIDRDIVVTSNGARKLEAWRTSTGHAAGTLAFPGPPPLRPEAGITTEGAAAAMIAQYARATQFASGGGLVAAWADGPDIHIWSGLSERPLRTIDTRPALIETAALTPDGDRLFAIAVDRGRWLKAWNPRTGQLQASIRVDVPDTDLEASLLTVSSDRRWLLTGVSSAVVTIRDASSLRVVRTLSNQGRVVTALDLSPDNRHMAIASGDRSLGIWDLATGTRLKSVMAPGAPHALRYSPDGSRLAMGIDDGTSSSIRVWKADTLEPLLSLNHEGLVRGEGDVPPPVGGARPSVRVLSFSPDGLKLASAWTDHTIRIFDATPKTPWQRSRDLLNGFVAERLFVDDMVARLNADASLSPETRAMAIGLAKSRTDSPASLNTASRTVVLGPGAPAADYELALRRAQAAVQLPPADADRFNTLALAFFRTGRYREGLEAASRGASLRAAAPGEPQRDNLNTVVSVLNRIKLGLIDDARRDLEALTGVAAADPWVGPLMREAENLLDARNPVARQARAFVRDLFLQFSFSDDVVAHLEGDRALTPTVRTEAIRLARARSDDPRALNTASWRVVKTPGASPQDYQVALRRAEQAVKLSPGNAAPMNTLAMAQYRIGEWERALATIGQVANAQSPRASQTQRMTDTVIAVMCRLRLGDRAAAQADLERLVAFERTIANSTLPADVDARALIQEARALAEGGRKPVRSPASAS